MLLLPFLPLFFHMALAGGWAMNGSSYVTEGLKATNGNILTYYLHTNTEVTRQNTSDGSSTRPKTENATMRISGLSECLKKPEVKEFAIEGATGHLLVQAPYRSDIPVCQLVLRVQTSQVVRFQINECMHIKFEYSEYFNVIKENGVSIICRGSYSPPFPVRYSIADTVMFKVYQVYRYHEGGNRETARFSLSFSAVDRSERQHLDLQRVNLSPSAGYIQTPGMDGSTSCSPLIHSCVTLTRPPDHIIFLSILIWQSVTRMLAFLGDCSCRQIFPVKNRWHAPSSFLFPDDFGNGTSKETHISLYVSFACSVCDCLRFRLRFSFHAEHLKPHLVPGLGSWNCSVSVWPDLFEHFLCDLKSQCTEHEDEAPCPYSSDRCGPGKIDAGGRCYVYHDERNHAIQRVKAVEECQRLGASLVSLETAQEFDAFVEVTKYSTGCSKLWIGMTEARFGTVLSLLNTMYTYTYRWETGAVVYFLLEELFRPQRNNDKCIYWNPCIRNFFTIVCEMFSTGFVCELPCLSDHCYINTPVTLPVLNSTAMSSVSLEICPMQHLTHKLLVCDVKCRCRKLENTEAWYRATCTMSRGLTQPYFYCDTSQDFVPYSLVCDFRLDCLDGRDEDFCEHPACEKGMIDCGNRQCVDSSKRCDGYNDCMTNADEEGCSDERRWFSKIRPPAVISFDKPGGFTIALLPENNTQCPDTHFQCHNDGYCLPVFVRCNDVIDCPGREDEIDCKSYKTCPGFYQCRGSYKTLCVHVNHLCDGLPQCPQHDDELACNTACPESCVCYGFAFSCNHTFVVSSFPQLRYLEASGSAIQMSDVTHNMMLIHLGVEACGMMNLTEVTLPNLHSVDLSNNLLHSINFSHVAGMPQLRRLNMAGNPLSSGISYFPNQFVRPSLTFFNMSHVQVNPMNISVLSALMPNLQVLDLSRNTIKVLRERDLFHNVRLLNLEGCPITDFTPDFLKQMTHLTHIFVDNFKLCCSVVLPDNFQGQCYAPSDEISSCDDLLKSTAYRCALMVFAVLAVLGNFGGFFYRILFSESTRNGFAVFIIHLCVSDFFMGMYLVFIGVADWLYAGIYVWNETSWKKSQACSTAGFLSLLSSEVSAFLICFVTLDRFLVLRFPFSNIRFRAGSAHVACVMTWALGLMLAMVPLLPVTSNWEFFHQTGICIPLPVTRADFAGHVYAFSIMVVCNMILFLFIGVGQFIIYWSVRSNTWSNSLPNLLAKSQDKGTESKEATIARRLISVAMSDFLCWFPIGLCGILAASGIVIPGEVNIGMAIFVLPLNSALNPFLYTLNIILEKRRKAQELRFQKLLRAQQKK